MLASKNLCASYSLIHFVFLPHQHHLSTSHFPKHRTSSTTSNTTSTHFPPSDYPNLSPPTSHLLTQLTHHVQPRSNLIPLSILAPIYASELGLGSTNQLPMQLRQRRRYGRLHRMRQPGLPRRMVPLEVCAGGGGAHRDVAMPKLQS